MSRLNADAIITLASAIPALLVASLSAWLAYLTLRYRNTSRNDIETSAIELFVAHTSTATLRPETQPFSSRTSTNSSIPYENLPQLPPVAILSDFDREPRRTRLSLPTMADQNQPTEYAKLAFPEWMKAS
ncbi:hypothetical protein FLAG1_05355 [Fusarium langsethiae]|uniref:Uncharacterized protein n=1 Tax=Fusarium langsethiae TaxID=179993 RepID=A0A0N0DEW8_FUSLA|nr:hypothetical protein FLAG1_05355 [Fusarium langsethiae]